jgi:hypothetical protein
MADNKLAYVNSAPVTISLASLASSSALVSGRSSVLIDNTSDKFLDRQYSVKIKMGTSPTVGQIEVWCIPVMDDTPTYFDTFDGTDKNVTVTSRGMLVSYGILLATIQMDSTTTGANFSCYAPLAARVGSIIPRKYQLFITHNCVAALNSTGGNHVVTELSSYITTV